MILTDAQRQSLVWQEIVRQLRERLEELRLQLEAREDPEIRGKIKEIRGMLLAGEAPPKQDDVLASFG